MTKRQILTLGYGFSLRDERAIIFRQARRMTSGVLATEEITWFHSIDLGNGVVTNGHKSAALLEEEFARLDLSTETLRGKRVLDIGCNDGFMCLRCERLGADVTGIDASSATVSSTSAATFARVSGSTRSTS